MEDYNSVTNQLNSKDPLGYYSILKVTENASTIEIKNQYKILTLIYHPDKHPDVQNASSGCDFARIAEAYAILTDEDKRRNYDKTGDPSLSCTSIFQKSNYRKGSDIHCDINIYEREFNNDYSIQFDKTIKCNVCAGTGSNLTHVNNLRCPNCTDGCIATTRPNHSKLDIIFVDCNYCEGRGNTLEIQYRCAHCNGKGHTTGVKSKTFIPVDAKHMFSGEGNQERYATIPIPNTNT